MNMGDKDGCVLLIESDLHAAIFIRAAFADARDGPFHVEWVANLNVGLRRLRKGKIRVFLLNLFLSDSQGIETFNKLYQIEQQIPILILSELDHEDAAKLAIDDFGTGYSSLSYLHQFPIDSLNIDQSFVYGIFAGNGDATIVSAVIGMGNSLKLRVSAEVETREHLAFLQAEKCAEGQGFYFSQPVDAVAFAELRGAVNAEYVVN